MRVDKRNCHDTRVDLDVWFLNFRANLLAAAADGLARSGDDD